MTVEDLLTGALVRYLQGGKGRELEYVSRSESSSLGWYFWLRGIPGVYEIERKEASLAPEGSEFYVRYYPGTEEPVLESYSVQEQLLRFDQSVFDDGLIEAGREEHEVCPCCVAAGSQVEGDGCGHPYPRGHHGHHGPASDGRRKGIPRLLKKFAMNKELYLIGTLCVSLRPDGSCAAELRTKGRLMEPAADTIWIIQDGRRVELVQKGAPDRDVPGYELSARFMDFFGPRFLGTVRPPAGDGPEGDGSGGPADAVAPGRLQEDGFIIRYVH